MIFYNYRPTLDILLVFAINNIINQIGRAYSPRPGAFDALLRLFIAHQTKAEE